MLTLSIRPRIRGADGGGESLMRAVASLLASPVLSWASLGNHRHTTGVNNSASIKMPSRLSKNHPIIEPVKIVAMSPSGAIQ